MTIASLTDKDDFSPVTGIKERDREQIGKLLSGVLANSFALYLKTLYYHWNVKGSEFVGMHSLFEEQYKNLQSANDAIAERIRSLGLGSPGTFKEFLQLDMLPEDHTPPISASEMVAKLLFDHETLSTNIRDTIAKSDRAQDYVTSDLLTQRLAFHEKNAWMLRSILEGQ